MKKLLALPVLMLVTLLATLLLSTSSSALGSAPRDRPVIVQVEGDAASGFGIEYADGSATYPPTDSESMAECSEYDRWVQRVRCRTEIRTWYRDLGDLQASLAWVRAHE